MNSRGLVIVAVVAIAILLVGSTAFSHSAEAKSKSKSGKIKVEFSDARGFQGKAKIKIWNLDTDKTLVKSNINFKKLNPSADCFCKTFSFKWKGNHVGDRIALRVDGWEDASGQWKLKQGTTRASITLDEIGE